MNKTVSNLLISLLSFFLCFAVAELYFRFCYIQSDGLGLTVSHKKWTEKYWKPINRSGLRDKEWTQKELKSKTTIAVVGDSIVSGHGINNVSDRFSDILAKNLGKDYAVVNISNPGWGTQTEFVILKMFPHNFDTIIWSYFPNDILDTANQFGKESPCQISEPKGFIGKVITYSHFANYVYWNIFRVRGLKDNYLEWLKNQFNDPQIWTAHKLELELVANLAKDKKLIIVLFPFLNKLEESLEITNKVKSVFKAKNIPILDVYDLASDLKQSELVVSKIDAHPSKKLHRTIGNKLFKIIKQTKDKV